MRPWLSATRSPGFGATETWLQGVGNDLKPGDALLFVGDEFLADPTTNDNWDFRLIDSVELETANDRTHVTWKRGLGSVSPHSDPPVAPQVHVLRKRAAVFGNNAPMWRSMNTEFKTNYPSDPDNPDEWPSFTISQQSPATWTSTRCSPRYGPAASQSWPKGEFNRPDEIDFATPLRRRYVELYKVTSTTEVSRAEFAISGKVTRLGLQGQNLDDSSSTSRAKPASMCSPSALALGRVPGDHGDRRRPSCRLRSPADGLQPGRRLIVKGDARGRRRDAGAPSHARRRRSRMPPARDAHHHAAAARGARARHGGGARQRRARDAWRNRAADPRRGRREQELPALRAQARAADLSQRRPTRPAPTASSACASTTSNGAERPTLFGAAPTERAYTLEHRRTGQDFRWCSATACAARGCRAG